MDFGTGLPLYTLSATGIALGWIVVAALVLIIRRWVARRFVAELLLWSYILVVHGLSLAFHGAILSGSLTICYGCPRQTSALYEVVAHAMSVVTLLLWPLAGLVPTYTRSGDVGVYLSLAVLLAMALAISACGLCVVRTACQKRFNQG